MNLAQLELKRLRSLLAGVRKARHLAQAMRGPLAKYLSFERQAHRAWNRPLEHLQMVKEYSSFEPFEPAPKERIEALDEFAKQLANDEKSVLKAIAKLETSKRLTAPSLPIEQRIATRKKRTKTEQRKAERKKAAWEAFQKRADMEFAAWLTNVAEFHAHDSLLAIRRLLRAGEVYDVGRELSIIRKFAGDGLADAVKALVDDARKISNS